MTALARTRFLGAIVALSVAGPVLADPLADLLPPPIRPLEKRTLGRGGPFEKDDFPDVMIRGYRGERGGFSAAFSPDGRFLVVSSMYNGLHLWDVASGRSLGVFGNGDRGEGMTFAVAPDGRHLVTVGFNGYGGRKGGGGALCPVTLWDLVKREKVRSLDEDANTTVFTAATFAPDGKTLALVAGFNRRGGNPTGVHLWDVASGDEIRRLEGIIPADANGVASARSVAYSPDGRTLGVFTDTHLLLVELATTKVRAQITVGKAMKQDQQMMRVRMRMRMMEEGLFPSGGFAFAPNGRMVVVAGAHGTLRRFEWPTLRELPPLPDHSAGVMTLGFNADGKKLLSFGFDQKLFVWPADAQRDWRPKAVTPNEELLARLWESLNSDDPVDLFGCAQVFASVPGPSVAFLRKRLTPVQKGNSERIDKLVADLLKDDYNARKRAIVELRKIGAPALPALRQAAERDEEGLVQSLLFELESLSSASPDEARALRALAALERIDTDEARALLGDLAKGASEAPFTLEAKAALERTTKGAGGLGAAAKLETLWEALGGDDSATAFQAARLLVARPDASPFLSDRLRELAASDAFDNDPKRVAKIIADLDSEDFETRDKAGKALKSLGRSAEPALRKAMEGTASAEVKRQLEEALAEVGRGAVAGELLRVGRTLETLEWMATPEARKAIEAAAKDARGPWLREAATAALRRMAG
jgi:WD40 repeat protein